MQGSEESRVEQREMLNSDAVAKEVSAQLWGSSRASLALASCSGWSKELSFCILKSTLHFMPLGRGFNIG